MTSQSTSAQFDSDQEQIAQIHESIAQLSAELALMRDDVGWQALAGAGAVEQFDKATIDEIAAFARLYAIKNPLIKRGIEVKRNYVFGQGVSIAAAEPAINAIVQAFIDDRRNGEVLFSQQAQLELERQAQTDGNLFFILFTNEVTGRVRVRDIDATEIARIIKNPEDAHEVWFYERRWTSTALDGTRMQCMELYPDWRYAPQERPATVNGLSVNWDAPIYHAKRDAFPSWDFGISEIYAGLDWAKAYKKFLENWATITQALARFAFRVTTPKVAGARGVVAAKSRLNSTLVNGADSERNPAPPAGSTFVAAEGYDLAPIKTAGATTSMEDGRRLLLMVAATVGLPETFFGDSAVGSLATARSLDRPTELMMRAIQGWWGQVFADICGYAIVQAVKAPSGQLRGLGGVVVDEEDNLEMVAWGNDPETGAPYTGSVSATFPPIVEIDPLSDMQALNIAAALVPDERTIAAKALSVLGFDNIDEILDRIFNADLADERTATAEAGLAEAIKELRAALQEVAA